MKQWYKTNIAKGILIVAEHILAAAVLVSLVWILAYSGFALDAFTQEPAKHYKDSTTFTQEMENASHNILAGLGAKSIFETDGRYDPERIVDIKAYDEETTINNQNESGFAYRLDDLAKWSKVYTEGSQGYENNIDSDIQIVVCEKSDGSYRYYSYDEFQKLVNSGELQLVMQDAEVMPQASALSYLKSGDVYEGSDFFTSIKSTADNTEYVDCWNYDGSWIDEEYAPVGAENIMEIANTNPQWNGNLDEMYSMVSHTLSRIYGQLDTYNSAGDWQEGDTNLAYLYVDTAAGKVYTNREEYEDFSKAQESLAKIAGMGRYTIVEPKLADFKTNIKNTSASEWREIVRGSGPLQSSYIYAVGVDTDYPIQDVFYTQNQYYQKYSAHLLDVAVIGSAAALLFLAGLIWLTVIAGRNTKDEELHLNWFDRWKTEIAAVVIIAIVSLAVMIGAAFATNVSRVTSVSGASDSFVYYGETSMAQHIVWYTVVCGIMAALLCGAFLIGYLSIVRRLKARTLWKNSLLRSLVHFLGQLFANMHFVWKTALIFAGFVLLHWMAFSTSASGFIFLALIAEAAAFIYLIRQAIARQKIRTGIERIWEGQVEYKIPTGGMKGEQLMLADRINSIGEGLDAALEESMRSERLKTDLITNVSHDIKTPLTSIINYVGLLKQEDFKDPKILRYLDVLDAKAQRLKTLTEDVVEASKVSSGNITLEYINLNLVEMIQQTSGEFEEKFADRNLKEVLSLPDGEAVIRADGRRMWRVLENIYNNAAKYALEGTRVYADLTVTSQKVIFSLKNISDQPLNITADELTERFIRGDVSRSTEGSGLGLSISKSLTEMQGGTFELYLDGDLFRVTITFPRMVKVDAGQNQG